MYIYILTRIYIGIPISIIKVTWGGDCNARNPSPALVLQPHLEPPRRRGVQAQTRHTFACGSFQSQDKQSGLHD